MGKFSGGMEFVGGKPVRLVPPAKLLACSRLRVTCRRRPEVVLGQTVKAGQMLTAPIDAAEPCPISPVAGTIHSIIRCSDGQSDESFYDVTILPSSSSEPTSLPISAPTDTALEGWHTALRQTGPWPLAGLGLDLVGEMAAAKKHRPDTLICLGLDAFAPYPDRSSILGSFTADAALGCSALGKIVGAANVMMLSGRACESTGALRKSCRNFHVKFMCADNVYPAADPTMAIWHYASGKRALAHGQSPMSQGVMLITPWTAVRLARWMTLKHLDVVQPMFVARSQPRALMHWRYAFVGAPLASLDDGLSGQAAGLHGRVVLGNPMTGRPPRESRSEAGPLPAVVQEDEHLVSILDRGVASDSEPCITCGWCVDVCPTRLRPMHLTQLAQQADNRAPTRGTGRLFAQLRWCIDCGLCTHVCPSHLPLGRDLRAARAKWIKTVEAIAS